MKTNQLLTLVLLNAVIGTSLFRNMAPSISEKTKKNDDPFILPNDSCVDEGIFLKPEPISRDSQFIYN